MTPALGASGPHGFTGAVPAVRPHAFACGDGASAHRSLSHVRDVRERPFGGTGWPHYAGDLRQESRSDSENRKQLISPAFLCHEQGSLEAYAFPSRFSFSRLRFMKPTMWEGKPSFMAMPFDNLQRKTPRGGATGPFNAGRAAAGTTCVMCVGASTRLGWIGSGGRRGAL